MARIFFLLCITLLSHVSFGQIYGGIKLNPGLDYMRSSNLKNDLAFLRRADPMITQWNAKAVAGINFGFGGFAEYIFSKKYSVIIEPTINFSNSSFNLLYMQKNIDANGDGISYRVSSHAKVSMMYFNIPLIFKYNLSSSRKLFAIAGVSLNYNVRPKIKSTEDSVTVTYYSNIVDKTTVYNLSDKAKMDVFKKANCNLVVGVGKSVTIFRKQMDVEIRYNFPLVNSQMYTTNSGFYNNTYGVNDRAFTSSGAANVGQQTGKPLNDFKMSSFNLVLRYTLFRPK